MRTRICKANGLLLIASLLWGTTFVAQRLGMNHMGPFLFSGLRFAIGAAFLAPLAWRLRKSPAPVFRGRALKGLTWWGTVLAGCFLCAGINLQQIGLVYTTAGKAGFITGLYVVIVPFLGLLWGQRPGFGLWAGTPVAVVGLHLLSMTKGFNLAPGDGWVLACAFAWSGQMLYLGWLSPKMNSYVLAFGQSLVCAALSLLMAFFFEDIDGVDLQNGWIPVLYGGIMSVGIGFTLQIIGQKDSPPAHAAIIFQCEAVVGAVSGWLILGETMGVRGLSGAALMLCGMLVAQLWPVQKGRSSDRSGQSEENSFGKSHLRPFA
jgi:drug/metabolite transporter (DMT)-like permease